MQERREQKKQTVEKNSVVDYWKNENSRFLEDNRVDDLDVTDRDNKGKEKGEIYVEKTRQAKTNELKEVDKLLLKQRSLSKLTPPFDLHPYHMVSKYGNSVILESSSGAQYKRNSSQAKSFNERKSPQDQGEKANLQQGPITK